MLGRTFVTRKITHAIAQIKCGKAQDIVLGNIDSKRDWGHAKDYVEVLTILFVMKIPNQQLACLKSFSCTCGIDWD